MFPLEEETFVLHWIRFAFKKTAIKIREVFSVIHPNWAKFLNAIGF